MPLKKYIIVATSSLALVSCSPLGVALGSLGSPESSEPVDYSQENCDLYDNCLEGNEPSAEQKDTADFDNENCDIYDTCEPE